VPGHGIGDDSDGASDGPSNADAADPDQGPGHVQSDSDVPGHGSDDDSDGSSDGSSDAVAAITLLELAEQLRDKIPGARAARELAASHCLDLSDTHTANVFTTSVTSRLDGLLLDFAAHRLQQFCQALGHWVTCDFSPPGPSFQEGPRLHVMRVHVPNVRVVLYNVAAPVLRAVGRGIAEWLNTVKTEHRKDHHFTLHEGDFRGEWRGRLNSSGTVPAVFAPPFLDKVADLVRDCDGLRVVVEGWGQDVQLKPDAQCPYWLFLTRCRDLHIPGQLDYTVVMSDRGGHLFPTTTEVWREHGATSIKDLLHAEDNRRIRTYSVLGLTHLAGFHGRTAQVPDHPADVAGLSTHTKIYAAINHSKTGKKNISRGAISTVTPQAWAAEAAEAPSNPVSDAMDNWLESWEAWASSAEHTPTRYEVRVSIGAFVSLCVPLASASYSSVTTHRGVPTLVAMELSLLHLCAHSASSLEV